MPKNTLTSNFILSVQAVLRALGHLFSPPVCACCSSKLLENEQMICTQCRWEMPLTYSWTEHENEVYLQFYNTILPIEEASAFFYFSKGSGYQQIIHHLKFHGQFQIGQNLGLWYGRELLQSGLYSEIDVIVPLPIHPSRQRTRGYNQSEYIARGLAAVMQLSIDSQSVIRSRKTHQQSHKHTRKERMANVEQAFSVKHPDRLQGKHLLLVDDVITTGTTLESCARTIMEAVPACKISIVALAYSRSR